MRKRRYIWFTIGGLIVVCSAIFALLANTQDFDVYYNSGRSFVAGRTDIYSPDFACGGVMDYRYLPSVVFLFVPFAILPYTAAKFLWLSLTIGSLAAAGVIARWTFVRYLPEFKYPNAVILIATVISAKYLILSIRYLNIHLIVLCLFFAAAYLAMRKRWLIAAFPMALATTIKVFPMLAVPYFALKRQWFFLAASGLLLLAVNVFPVLYYGPSANAALVREWYDHVVVSTPYYELNGPINLSIKGQLERFVTEINYAQSSVDTNFENINIASLEPVEILWIARLLGLVIVFGTFVMIWFAEKRSLGPNGLVGPPNDGLWLYEFGLIVCMILAIEPRTNLIYFAALFIPMLGFLHSLFTRPAPWKKAVMATAFIVTCLLPLVPGAARQRLLLVYGPELFLTLGLWASLGGILVSETLRLRQTVEGGRDKPQISLTFDPS